MEKTAAEIQAEREARGKDGKLWRIEVLFSVGNETKRHELRNRFSSEVMEFRERVFDVGLMVAIDPGHWQIVPPADILEIHVFKQPTYYNDLY